MILRLDVAFLFLIGCLYAMFGERLKKKVLVIITVIITALIGIFFTTYLKFPSAFLIFILLIDLKFKFFNTGKFSYLLHLYHSPIIVISYPLLSLYIEHPLLKITAQIVTALIVVYGLFLITKRFKFLKILTGGR